MEGPTLTGMAAQLIGDICGPVFKEIGEMLRDELRPYRAVRERQLAEKTARMVQEAGFQPKAVSPKLLFTVFDNGGIEDDEDMHTRWAALLANAADPATEDIIPPSFPEILKQLSKRDAHILKELYDVSLESESVWPPHDLGTLEEMFIRFSEFTNPQVFSTIEHLRHQSLIDEFYVETTQQAGRYTDITRIRRFRVTQFGGMFVRACEPPKKRE